MSRSGPNDSPPLYDVASLIETRLSTERVRVMRAYDIHPHAHTAHELIWGFDGPRTIATDGATWSLPPTVGLWIPAGTVHHGWVPASSTYHCTFVHPARVDIATSDPTPIAITPVLRELLLHLHAADMPAATRDLLERAAIELIQPISASTLAVPMPDDERARLVALALIGDPSDQRTIDEWGRHVGAAGRTLHRLFVRETGLTFGRWRAHVRTRAAIPLLARGDSVGEAGRRTGYDTASSFVRAFKGVTGTTPRTFVAHQVVATHDSTSTFHVLETVVD